MDKSSKPVISDSKRHGQLDCVYLINVMLPAVRASVAEKLSMIGYRQEKIATELGIAQAAVSKYKMGRYSEEVAAMKKHINMENLNNDIIDSIIKKKGKEVIENNINELCEKIITEQSIIINRY